MTCFNCKELATKVCNEVPNHLLYLCDEHAKIHENCKHNIRLLSGEKQNDKSS